MFNHAFVPAKELTYVLRFYKRSNSTIGLNPERHSEVSFAPNPVGGRFEITTAGTPSQGLQLQVMNLSGKLYEVPITQNKERVEVDSSTLPKGVYIGILSREHEKSIGRFKFVK